MMMTTMMTTMMILIIDYNDIDYDYGDDDKAPGDEQKRAGRARPTIIINSLHNPPTIIELMMIVKELFNENMPQWMTSCGWRVMFLRLFRARVVVMMGVKMMSLMSVMMMMVSYNGVDGDNKRTKVLMIKRSFVWCTFWLAGGIQDRKEFGTRVHEICANHIVLIVMIVVLAVNIMLIVMIILLIHKIIVLIIVI